MNKYFSFLMLFLLSQPLNSQKKRISFIPVSFYRSFSPNNAPVLKINPGDTVATESIDALGFDKNGTKRSERGNPLTGPFYIENVLQGDVIAITLLKISLNRTYATTVETFVTRSLPKTLIKQVRRGSLVRWNLDLQNGFASPVVVYEHLQNFKTPLNPFLGCLGVAAPAKGKEVRTFNNGPYGGNLDFSRVTESATIYLPVFHDGALLYLGDGHAAQGDGELNGDALETSMDFEFTVNVIKKAVLTLAYPRMEDSVYIMSIGLEKSLDRALKSATQGLLEWLQQDYRLSLQEATQVIGTSIEYKIAEIADPKVEVVAMIKKEILKGLKKYN